MARKLTAVLLVVGLCLMGVIPGLAQKVYSTLAEYEKLTGKRIEKFNEAPMLKIKVAAGELPPVEQRLPEEPMVVEPLEEIGQYGGTLRTAALNPNIVSGDTITPRHQDLFAIIFPRLNTVVPNIAKGWDWSKDFKTLTIYLRKGMKWSDGVPFTADDFLFWWEDIILNKELTPIKPTGYKTLTSLERVDDYTVRLQFSAPNPSIIYALAVIWGGCDNPFAPKHYLKKYHISYNPEAQELAKKEGFDSWWQCFQFHQASWGPAQQDIDFPTLDPWVLKKIDSFGNKYYERNPYYWKIDTVGNQLPYIDKQARILVENQEVGNLKTIAGEFDIGGQDVVRLRSYPLYKKGEKKGNYHVMLWKNLMGSDLAFNFNLTHKDPVLRKIFNDIRFRQAMSLAINRDEINQLLFFGKAVPRQATTDPSNSLYEDWMGKYYAEYDPKRANKLLDEMGLKWDEKHQYRLRPDGKPLAITIEYVGMEERGKICELVKDYWEKVGVKTAIKEVQRNLYNTRAAANEIDVGNWRYETVTEIEMYYHTFKRFVPFWGEFACRPWRKWYDTGGESGEEPPEEVKRLFKVAEEFQTTLPGTEEYMKLGKEILTINLKNLWLIGTVGLYPQPVIVKK